MTVINQTLQTSRAASVIVSSEVPSKGELVGHAVTPISRDFINVGDSFAHDALCPNDGYVLIKTPKHDYIDFLIQLFEKPPIQNNPITKTIVKGQVEELMNQTSENLTERQHESYKWIQKLLTDGKVSQLVLEKLQTIHQVDCPSPPIKKENPALPISLWGRFETLFYSIYSLMGIVPPMAFGKTAWATHFGDIGEEPLLPVDIDQLLQSPCPIWPEKTVQETHVLVLIPASINGQPFNLATLGELIKKPKQGAATQFTYLTLGQYQDLPVQQPYWILMSRDILEESRHAGCEANFEQVANLAQNTGIPYAAPKVLEAATCVLMHHVSTGQKLYNGNLRTLTRCQEDYSQYEKLSVGGFGDEGLSVFVDHEIFTGIGVCRKLGEYEPPILK